MGSMNFAEGLARLTGVPVSEILSSLGECGENGETPHECLRSGVANFGEFAIDPPPSSVPAVANSPDIRQAETRMDSRDSPNSPHSPQHESETCNTCQHRCRSGCCGMPVEAGLSPRPGVIRYHPEGGRGCRAWKPPAPDPLEGLPDEVAALIRLAGECYGYDAEDYRLAASVARRDPEAMRAALATDAQLQALRARAGQA